MGPTPTLCRTLPGSPGPCGSPSRLTTGLRPPAPPVQWLPPCLCGKVPNLSTPKSGNQNRSVSLPCHMSPSMKATPTHPQAAASTSRRLRRPGPLQPDHAGDLPCMWRPRARHVAILRSRHQEQEGTENSPLQSAKNAETHSKLWGGGPPQVAAFREERIQCHVQLLFPWWFLRRDMGPRDCWLPPRDTPQLTPACLSVRLQATPTR